MCGHVFGQSESARKANGSGIALRGQPINLGPAGIGQAEDACHLVEGLPRGIINRFAEQFNVAHHVAHHEERRVSARDKERDGRHLEGPLRTENVGPHMAHEVVDRVDGCVEGHGERLCRTDAHHERARQARATSYGDGIDLGQRDSRLRDRRANGRLQCLEVGTRRHLRHHSAVARVPFHRR